MPFGMWIPAAAEPESSRNPARSFSQKKEHNYAEWQHVLVIRHTTAERRKFNPARAAAVAARLEASKERFSANSAAGSDEKMARRELIVATKSLMAAQVKNAHAMRAAMVVQNRLYKETLQHYRREALQYRIQMGALRAEAHRRDVALTAEIFNSMVTNAAIRRQQKIDAQRTKTAHKMEAALESSQANKQKRRETAMLMRHKYFNPPSTPASPDRSCNELAHTAAVEAKRLKAQAVTLKAKRIVDTLEETRTLNTNKLMGRIAADQLTAAILRETRQARQVEKNRLRKEKTDATLKKKNEAHAAMADKIAARLEQAAMRKKKELFIRPASSWERNCLQPTCSSMVMPPKANAHVSRLDADFVFV